MRRTGAFTLIELLVVIAVIAVLMGILMPALSRVREQARAGYCLSNLRQIGICAHLYAQDYEYKVPRYGSLWPLKFMVYTALTKTDKVEDFGEVKAYKCPSYPNKEQKICYVINALKLGTTNPNGEQTDKAYTPLDDFPRKARTIYLADYEYDIELQNVRMIRTEEELRQNRNYLDVHRRDTLPSGAESTRRMARMRHKPKGVNCVFVDGHAAKVNSMDVTLYDLGASFRDEPAD